MHRVKAISAILIGMIGVANQASHPQISVAAQDLAVQRDSTAQPIAGAVEQIHQQYNNALRKADGNSDLQVAAELDRRKKLARLGRVHIAKLDSIKPETELTALANAFEAAGDSDKALVVTRRLLATHPGSSKGHKLNIRYRVNHASGEEALLAMETAASVVPAKEMKPLLPYWGVLGFKFANERKHQQSISCFDRYLKSRYKVAETSVEPLPVLPTILRKVREQYLQIADRPGYVGCLGKCDQSLANAAASRLAKKEEPQDEDLLWRFHHHIVNIFLTGELQKGDPLTAYGEFLEMSIQNTEWVGRRDDFPTMLQHATQMVIATSHAWKSQPQNLELSGVSLNADNDAEQSDRVVSLIRAAVSQVKKHGNSVSKLKKFSSRLSIQTWEQAAGVKDASMPDEVYVLCLARKPSAMVYRLRKQLAELALHHSVIVGAESDDERLVLNRQLKMLPKPIEMANSPFRIRVAQRPNQGDQISVAGDDVNWLVVKDQRVVGQWVGGDEEKISQIRWQLISK